MQSEQDKMKEAIASYKAPEETVVDSLFLDAGDGGVRVSVIDQHGPTIKIESSHFGNMNQSFFFMTDVNGLEAIRNMLDSAIKQHKFSKPYVNAAILDIRQLSNSKRI